MMKKEDIKKVIREVLGEIKVNNPNERLGYVVYISSRNMDDFEKDVKNLGGKITQVKNISNSGWKMYFEIMSSKIEILKNKFKKAKIENI